MEGGQGPLGYKVFVIRRWRSGTTRRPPCVGTLGVLVRNVSHPFQFADGGAARILNAAPCDFGADHRPVGISTYRQHTCDLCSIGAKVFQTSTSYQSFISSIR